MRKFLFPLFVLMLFASTLFAQQKVKKTKVVIKNKDLIQFSGVIVASDSLVPIPYGSIIVSHTNRGTISDFFGYFSFVAKKNDTIEFSAIGYTSATFVIPDTLTSNTYSLIQVLHSDTISLAPVSIHAWPSKEHFKQAFLNLNVPDRDGDNARKNMEIAALKEQMVGMAMDASQNYKYGMDQNQSKLYYAGQYPVISLLNPVAWAKFIKAWKNGDFNKPANSGGY